MSRAERASSPSVPAAPYYSRYTERKGSSEFNSAHKPTIRTQESSKRRSKEPEVETVSSRSQSTSTFGKHTVTFIAAAAFKTAHIRSKKKTASHSSCPNLVSPSSESNKEGETQLRGSDSALESLKLNGSNTASPTSRQNELRVPVDIFTTSFTHSKPPKSPPSPPSPSSGKQGCVCRSLQDIPGASKASDKLNLRRTTSFNKSNHFQLKKVLQILPPSMYKDDQIAQLTDYLFIGSIEVAFNERRLCRLDIESLVDISNMNEMDIPSSKKPTCPCLCQTEFRHFRSRLIISVADEEKEQHIDQYFDEVSRFIEGARRCGKKVLIYSYEGKSRSALFAMQYLMSFEGLLLRQAYNLVKKQRPGVALNPGFQRALESLEKSLFPDAKPSVNMCNEYLNVADPQSIKCAWIDC